MEPETTPHGPIDITDILALVVLFLASMRRLSVRVAQPEDHPHVHPQQFAAWKQAAESAYSLAIQASFLKFVLNTIWYFGARTLVPPPVLALGGALFFVGWIVALTMAWRRTTAARMRQAELGIILRGRPGDREHPENRSG